MKVKELIEKLRKEDPEALVVCQRDPEGNGHSPLSKVEGGDDEGFCAYLKAPWFGERRLRFLSQESKNQGFTEEDVDVAGEKAVFLVPLN